jgi:hypothetical protein
MAYDVKEQNEIKKIIAKNRHTDFRRIKRPLGEMVGDFSLESPSVQLKNPAARIRGISASLRQAAGTFRC